MVFFAERLEAAFPIQIILYDFFLDFLAIHFRIAVEETPARLAASRPRIRPARHSSMSQILNSGSISFRLLILILSLFQCLCYREHIIEALWKLSFFENLPYNRNIPERRTAYYDD